jgi:hypothetical protein
MENFYIMARVVLVAGPPTPVDNQLFPINSWFVALFFAEHEQPPTLQAIKKGNLWASFIFCIYININK